MHFRLLLAVAACCCMLLCLGAVPASARPLDAWTLQGEALEARLAAAKAEGEVPTFANVGNVYVSGISSGGFMASQLHVAYSRFFKGAGIFAAGPYGCARGSLVQALSACMYELTADLNLPLLQTLTVAASDVGTIDPVTNLQKAPVWVFHGSSDSVVSTTVSDATVNFYRHFGSNVRVVNGTDCEHAWVSPRGVNPCNKLASPYVSNCNNTDPQADMLTHMMGRTPAQANKASLKGKLTSFSQDLYALRRWKLGANMLSMDSTGWVYTPPQCADGSVTCDVMLLLHGCKQATSFVGKALIEQANMNQYADTNNLIVIYPQTISLALGVVLNPDACWDWWGYLGGDLMYTVQGSYQMEVLVDMIKAMRQTPNQAGAAAAPSPPSHADRLSDALALE